jgi:hypothetical protein
MRLPPVNFLGRRAALAFIATIPGIKRKFSWDWMDGSMPNNEWRKEWLAEATVAGLGRVLKMEVLYLKILREFLCKYMALEMSQPLKVPVTSS